MECLNCNLTIIRGLSNSILPEENGQCTLIGDRYCLEPEVNENGENIEICSSQEKCQVQIKTEKTFDQFDQQILEITKISRGCSQGYYSYII